MISSRVKSLLNHNFQVTQNKQFIAHPTWEEIQRVIRFSFGLSSFTYFSFCRWYIRIASIMCQSLVLKANFVVSSASTVSITSIARRSKCSFSSFLKSLESVVSVSRSVFWFLYNSKNICFNLNGWSFFSLARFVSSHSLKSVGLNSVIFFIIRYEIYIYFLVLTLGIIR